MHIFVAREEDAHQGWVWLDRPELPARSVVKITNPATGQSVHCEALQIDANFLSKYNQSPRFYITDSANSLVIAGWYRAALGGVVPQSDAQLEIKPSNSWWGHYKSCTDHPQIVVRLATRLGGIGLLLGIIGLILGIASLC
jgi:hypothetical protein